MKKTLYLSIILAMIVSCKEQTAKTTPETMPIDEDHDIEDVLYDYPEDLSKVLDAHGGIVAWYEMETLEFSVEKPGGYEITTTDLKEHFALIEMPENTIGFDGDVIWIKHKDNAVFEGDPKTYYNMMFNLYAMPFVLGDDGLAYATASPLTFERKTYPGIAIAFEHESPASPFSDYILYYDNDSYQVAWLAYKASGSEWQFVNYTNWQSVEDLLLPETMVWYHVENMQPTRVMHEVNFVSPMLTTVKMDIRVYGRPDGGELVQ